MIPNKEERDDNTDSTIQNISMISLINYFLIVGATNMTLQIIRVQKEVGQTVKLVSACIRNLIAFLIFFLSFVTIFSVLHRVLGNDQHNSDDQSLNEFWQYWIHTWKMSTGSSKPPNTIIWSKIDNYNNSFLF